MNMDFIKNRYKFFLVSGFLLAVTVFALIYRGGPNYGIDFAGGIFMQISFKSKVKLQNFREAVKESGINFFELQSSENVIILRTKKGTESLEEVEKLVKNSIESKFSDNVVKIDKVEYVGSTVGKYFLKQAVYAFLFAFLGMIVYLAFRFKSSLWGIVSVIGVLHDVFICFGFLVFASKEINITVVAALLAVAGYSINDTVVLFDRIKENLEFVVKENLSTVINKSINEVLARTVVTSFTVFIIACSLFFLGGEVIHTFAYVMIIGTVVGVFSSIFVCAPIVYEWEIRKNKRLKKVLP
jgi:preprotein translocase subunit SecF